MNLPSASNRQVTLLRKLDRKKYRYEERLFLVEGARAVEQLLQNGVVSVEVLFFDKQQQYWQQQQWNKHLQKYDGALLPSEIFAEVSDTDTPQGILALCNMPDETEVKDMSMSAANGLVFAFDAVQDPGNLGTIIRTACWFGVKGILSGKGTVDLYHPKVVRSTAGATGMIPYKNGDLTDLLPPFEKAGWPVYLLDKSSEAVDVSEVSSSENAVIVAGNEAHGIDEKLMSTNRRKVQISSSAVHSGVESLNVAMASSIALYEFSKKQNSSKID